MKVTIRCPYCKESFCSELYNSITEYVDCTCKKQFGIKVILRDELDKDTNMPEVLVQISKIEWKTYENDSSR